MISSKDGVAEWAKRQMAEWQQQVEMMEKRYFGTFEIREGQKVDTTQESIDTTKVRIADLEALIDRHEAATRG